MSTSGPSIEDLQAQSDRLVEQLVEAVARNVALFLTVADANLEKARKAVNPPWCVPGATGWVIMRRTDEGHGVEALDGWRTHVYGHPANAWSDAKKVPATIGWTWEESVFVMALVAEPEREDWR